MKTKSLFIILIITASLLAAAALPAQASYESSLKGYWKLDQTDTPSLNQTPNAVNSGQYMTESYDATLVSSGGKYGGGYSFDGTQDSLTLYLGPNNPILSTSQNTISAWYYLPATYANHGMGIFEIGIYNYSVDIGMGVGTDGKAGVGMWDPVHSISTGVSSTIAYTDQWVHVAATVAYDGTNTTVKFYQNGILVGTNTAPLCNAQGNRVEDQVDIGNAQYSYPASAFKGVIDDVAIWNEAKNAEDIYKLYVNGIHDTDAVVHKAEISSFFTAYGLTADDAILSAAVSHTSGTVASGTMSHYEPVFQTNPYKYTFSSYSGSLDAWSWGWGVSGNGQISNYASLDAWYEKAPYGAFITANGDAIIDENETWFMKTGGGVEGEGSGPVPEPATVVSLISGLLMLSFRKLCKRTKR